MTLVPSTMNVSPSKLRRSRAAATKQKLYEAVSKFDSMMMVQSQLAMLTTAVDSLTSQMYTMMYENPYGLCFTIRSYVHLQPEDPAGAHDLTSQ